MLKSKQLDINLHSNLNKIQNLSVKEKLYFKGLVSPYPPGIEFPSHKSSFTNALLKHRYSCILGILSRVPTGVQAFLFHIHMYFLNKCAGISKASCIHGQQSMKAPKVRAHCTDATRITGPHAKMTFEIQDLLQRCLSNYMPSCKDGLCITGPPA